MAGDVGRVGDQGGEFGTDEGAKEVPAAADRGLGDAEDRAGQFLGEVVAVQGHDQGGRSVQAQCGWSASGADQGPEPEVDAGGDVGELFVGQSGYTLQVQRLFRFVWLVFSTPDFSGGAVAVWSERENASGSSRFGFFDGWSDLCGEQAL